VTAVISKDCPKLATEARVIASKFAPGVAMPVKEVVETGVARLACFFHVPCEVSNLEIVD
jgi:hypothetical protein